MCIRDSSGLRGPHRAFTAHHIATSSHATHLVRQRGLTHVLPHRRASTGRNLRVVPPGWVVDNSSFGSLDEAVEAARDGDTLTLHAGRYTSGTVIDKRLELVGAEHWEIESGRAPSVEIYGSNEKSWVLKCRGDVKISRVALVGLWRKPCVEVDGGRSCLLYTSPSPRDS
eukprot:TRINITY_DN31917_c0_g1_i1.p1 TRINITY_DN31917_c0_g1~~TRINITY_DN31917_c0_g1_i1.p1  ORF type:complete len:170 (+),score=31.17 TRINITY_DN31917_c0_g1_i1:128-637(+)